MSKEPFRFGMPHPLRSVGSTTGLYRSGDHGRPVFLDPFDPGPSLLDVPTAPDSAVHVVIDQVPHGVYVFPGVSGSDVVGDAADAAAEQLRFLNVWIVRTTCRRVDGEERVSDDRMHRRGNGAQSGAPVGNLLPAFELRLGEQCPWRIRNHQHTVLGEQSCEVDNFLVVSVAGVTVDQVE